MHEDLGIEYPICLMVVLIADRCCFTYEGAQPLVSRRKARKLATSIEGGLQGLYFFPSLSLRVLTHFVQLFHMVEYEELERSLNPLATNFVVKSDAPDERRDFRTASKREDLEIADFRKVFLISVVLEILLVDEDVEGGRV